MSHRRSKASGRMNPAHMRKENTEMESSAINENKSMVESKRELILAGRITSVLPVNMASNVVEAITGTPV